MWDEAIPSPKATGTNFQNGHLKAKKKKNRREIRSHEILPNHVQAYQAAYLNPVLDNV